MADVVPLALICDQSASCFCILFFFFIGGVTRPDADAPGGKKIGDARAHDGGAIGALVLKRRGTPTIKGTSTTERFWCGSHEWFGQGASGRASRRQAPSHTTLGMGISKELELPGPPHYARCATTPCGARRSACVCVCVCAHVVEPAPMCVCVCVFLCAGVVALAPMC